MNSEHPRRSAAFFCSLLLVATLSANPMVNAQERRLATNELGAIIWGQGKQIQGQIHLGEPVVEQCSLWKVTTADSNSQGSLRRASPFPIEKYFDVTLGIQCVILMETRKMRMGKSMGRRWSSVTLPVRVPLASKQLFSLPFLILYGKEAIVFNQQEIDNLREYLLSRGGFLIADEAVSVMGTQDGKFLASIREGLRQALPEHDAEPIPDDHDIYHTFHELPGAPPGHAGADNPLEGLFIDGRLAALLSSRSYSTLWTFSTTGVEYIPEVFPFTLNVILYAVTHGNISDYSKYTR